MPRPDEPARGARGPRAQRGRRGPRDKGPGANRERLAKLFDHLDVDKDIIGPIHSRGEWTHCNDIDFFIVSFLVFFFLFQLVSIRRN